MKILGIETSTTVTSVAICDDDRVIGQFTTDTGILHSKSLLPMTESLINVTGESLDGVDLFAVSCGPGSFTGLRVGMSVIKGLAVAANKPVAAVSSLKCLAFNLCGCLIGEDCIVCALIDARCFNVYAGMFRLESGKIMRLEEDQRICVDNLKDKLQTLEKTGKRVILVGNVEGLCYNNESEIWKAWGERAIPSAVSVCKLARDESHWCLASELNPEYLKAPQITEKRR